MPRHSLRLVALLTLAAARAAAQTRSPMLDLLVSARGALNDLRFADADSLTQLILAYPQVRRAERIQALQIAAGALYPEQEGARRKELAEAVLHRLVRIAPSAGLPREVSWPGLDEMYQVARRETFGASATVREKNVVAGPSETIDVDVVATRPAVFVLTLAAAGEPAVVFDSIQVTERGTLRIRALKGRTPALRSGNYELGIRAVDVAQTDTIELRYDAVAEVPVLELASVPDRFNESILLPEVTRPKRTLGIVAGALVAAGTIVASSVLREEELKGVQAKDGRAVPLGIVLGGITAGGVWFLDHGQPIPRNIAANRATKEGFERSVLAANTLNEDRVRSFRVLFTINPEAK